MFSVSISATSAQATDHAIAPARILIASSVRSCGSITLESRMPRMRRRGSRITAEATTGPASGPRPASSTPARKPSRTRLNASCAELIASPSTQQCNYGLRRTRARVTAQRLVDGCESLHELIAIGTLQLRQHGGAEHVGAHLVVEILRDHLTAGEQVRLCEERCLEEFQSLKQKSCQ